MPSQQQQQQNMNVEIIQFGFSLVEPQMGGRTDRQFVIKRMSEKDIDDSIRFKHSINGEW